MWRELTKKHMLDTKAHFAPDEAMQQYALASEILLTFMGKDWWKEKCTHDKSMMSIGSDNLPLEYRQQFIITNLADCIFLVKDTQNILDWTTKRLHEKDIYSQTKKSLRATLAFCNGRIRLSSGSYPRVENG